MVGGGEFEEVFVHESGGDAVAAGEHFELGFVEGVGCVGFGADDEAFAVEACEFGGVFLEGFLHEESGG